MHANALPRRHDRAYRALPAAALAVVALATAGAAYAGSRAGGQPLTPEPPHLAIAGGGLGGRAMGPALDGPPRPFGGYQLRGTLPAGPDRGQVYQLSSPLPSDQLARLATALGLHGAPRHANGRLTLTENGSTLTVADVAGHPWNFVAARPGPIRWFRQPDPPTADAARQQAAPVFAAAGLNAADATVSAGAPVATVRLDPTVNGLPTAGYATNVSVDPAGVVSAQGWLGGVSTGVDYPVVSAQAAFDALRADTTPIRYHRYCPLLRDAPSGGPASSPASGSAEPFDPVDPAPGGPPPVCASVPDSTVTGARFGLFQRWQAGGEPMLVPAWLFSVIPAGANAAVTVPRIAVDPAYLRTVGPDGAELTVPGARQISSARVSADGRTLTALVGGAPQGDGPCQAVYRPTTRQYPSRVVLGVLVAPNTRPVSMRCPAIAQMTPVTVHLDQPLGDRALDDGATGRDVADVRHD